MPTDACFAVTHPSPAPGTRRHRSADDLDRSGGWVPAAPPCAAVRTARSGAVWLCAVAVAGVFAVSPRVAAADAADVLEFHVMTPVTGPYVGATNPIRGVSGGGFPWVITRGRGHLEANGQLEIRVRGLVLADDPVVPVNLQLTNPVANFRAIVSCMSIDADGNPSTVNVETKPFPATPKGDSEIDATVSLPSPCIVPVVFVTSPSGAWFAATGN